MSIVLQALGQNSNFNVAVDLHNDCSDLIIFLHGLGCSRHTFSSVFSEAVFAKYSIMTIDFLGFGDSSKPENWSYTLEDHASIISQIIAQVPYTKIHLIAHSFAGAVALLLDATIQAKIKTFINCEGNLIAEDCGLASRRTISTSFAEFKENILPEFEKTFPTGPGFFEFNKMLPYAFYQTAMSLVQWSDSGDLLRRFFALQCKKAYLFGDRNWEMPILSKIPDILKVQISGAGHFMFADNPDETYLLISQIIKDV